MPFCHYHHIFSEVRAYRCFFVPGILLMNNLSGSRGSISLDSAEHHVLSGLAVLLDTASCTCTERCLLFRSNAGRVPGSEVTLEEGLLG